MHLLQKHFEIFFRRGLHTYCLLTVVFRYVLLSRKEQNLREVTDLPVMEDFIDLDVEIATLAFFQQYQPQLLLFDFAHLLDLP